MALGPSLLFENTDRCFLCSAIHPQATSNLIIFFYLDANTDYLKKEIHSGGVIRNGKEKAMT